MMVLAVFLYLSSIKANPFLSFGLHGDQREPVHGAPCEVFTTIPWKTLVRVTCL